jgi:hypothetical protein
MPDIGVVVPTKKEKNQYKKITSPRAQCYKAFYVCNLRIFIIS